MVSVCCALGLGWSVDEMCGREIVLNSVSLVCGFLGNFALLCNFTRRIRYVVALPLSIIMWYFATGIVCFLFVEKMEAD